MPKPAEQDPVKIFAKKPSLFGRLANAFISLNDGSPNLDNDPWVMEVRRTGKDPVVSAEKLEEIMKKDPDAAADIVEAELDKKYY